MSKPKNDAFVSLLYLAHALPTLRRQSDEAACLVEAAIVECAMSIADAGKARAGELDAVSFLRYALDDVAGISPTGLALLERAIRSLKEEKRDVAAETSVVH